MTKQFPVEADVKREVKKLLDKHEWFHFSPPANQYGSNGISDILAVKAGVFLAIETKLKKSTGSANQEVFMASVRAHGGQALLVNQQNLPEFAAILVRFDRKLAGTET